MVRQNHFKSMKAFIKVSLASFAIAAVLVISTPQVQAWGQNGHRIVGQIALNHLTPVAREKVIALLSGDKLPEVTTWADEQRSNPEHFWQKESPRWHYINASKDALKKLPNYQLPHHHAPTDIYTAILKNITVLQDPKANNIEKEFHLRFLTHLIGDVHMPLHAGRSEDKGGNAIKVKFFGEKTNLHRLWDTDLIDSQKLSYTEFSDFIDTNDPALIKEYLNTQIHEWVYESHRHTQHIYEIGNGDFRWNYQYEYMPLVKQRLLQAGIRLAGVLNKIFDPNAKAGTQAINNFN